MHIALSIELWQILVAFAAVIASWAVALYKINLFSAFHRQHFAHAADTNIHQTADQRKMMDLLTKSDLKAHSDLDDQKFKEVTAALAEIKSESTKWQATLNASLMELTKALINNR